MVRLSKAPVIEASLEEDIQSQEKIDGSIAKTTLDKDALGRKRMN